MRLLDRRRFARRLTSFGRRAYALGVGPYAVEFRGQAFSFVCILFATLGVSAVSVFFEQVLLPVYNSFLQQSRLVL